MVRVSYRRLWSFGMYEHEAIELSEDFEDVDKGFEQLKAKVEELHAKSMADKEIRQYDFQIQRLEERKERLQVLHKEVLELEQWMNTQGEGIIEKLQRILRLRHDP